MLCIKAFPCRHSGEKVENQQSLSKLIFLLRETTKVSHTIRIQLVHRRVILKGFALFILPFVIVDDIPSCKVYVQSK